MRNYQRKGVYSVQIRVGTGSIFFSHDAYTRTEVEEYINIEYPTATVVSISYMKPSK